MPVPLAGLPIAITGASSGIGLAAARACAARGMPVLLAARRTDKLEEAAASIRAAGGRAAVLACDVTRKEDCERVTTATIEAFGSIYSVFANAGYGFEASVMDMDEQALRDIIEANFFGSFWTVRAAAAHMLAQPTQPLSHASRPRGHILLCSSALSKLSIPHFAAYSITKSAQDHLARAMRAELHDAGVFVSSVHPIGTNTEFSQGVTQRSGHARKAKTPEAFRQHVDVVARAVVRCLERPRGEVWTSTPARLLGALAVAWPSLADRVLARRAREK